MGGKPVLLEAVILFVLAVACYSPFLGTGYLPFDNDPLYADVIRHMVSSGDWLNPIIHGIPFLDKPPLFFWMGAVSVATLGETMLALRLPAMLCGAFCVALVWWGARRSGVGPMGALIAAFTLMTAPLWVEYTRRAYMEVPVALSVMAGILAFQHGLTGLDDRGGRPRWFVVAGLLTGIGFMLKSLVGLFAVLPFPVMVVLTRRWQVLRSRWLWLGALASVLTAGPWHIYQLVTNKDVFWDFTYRLHVEDQFLDAQPWSAGPPSFYLEKLVHEAQGLGVVLALGVVGFLALATFARRRPSWLDVHLLVALAVMLAVFSVSETKKLLYLVVIVPPSGLLLGSVMSKALPRQGFGALVFLTMALLGWPTLELMNPDGVLLRGVEAQVPAAEAAADLLEPRESLNLLDIYFSAMQYHSGHRAISWWSSDRIVRQTQRIPYIRYGENMRHLPPESVLQTLLVERPGVWILRRETFDQVSRQLEAAGRPVYVGPLFVVIRTRSRSPGADGRGEPSFLPRDNR